jgi:hypothetical protein
MRLLLQSVMIFFGTLLAAALLALGEPGGAQALAARQMAGTTGQTAQTAWQERTTAQAAR